MDAIFLEPIKDVIFNCNCGWSGSELELDILHLSESNLICCPICHNDDVRVSNDNQLKKVG
jgi:Zn finger protein HypA/HybF involved in hydrogenase expression